MPPPGFEALIAVPRFSCVDSAAERAVRQVPKDLPDRHPIIFLCPSAGRVISRSRTSFLFLDGVGILYFLKPSLDFLMDQFRILQQLDDLLPDDFIQVILADRSVMAHSSIDLAIIIRPQTAIIINLPFGCAGRGTDNKHSRIHHKPASHEARSVQSYVVEKTVYSVPIVLPQEQSSLHLLSRERRSQSIRAVDVPG